MPLPDAPVEDTQVTDVVPQRGARIRSKQEAAASDAIYNDALPLYGHTVATKARDLVTEFWGRHSSDPAAQAAWLEAQSRGEVNNSIDQVASQVGEQQRVDRQRKFDDEYKRFILDPAQARMDSALPGSSRQKELQDRWKLAHADMQKLEPVFEKYYQGQILGGAYGPPTLPQLLDAKLPVHIANFFNEGTGALIQGQRLNGSSGPLTNDSLDSAVYAAQGPNIQRLLQEGRDTKAFSDHYEQAINKLKVLYEKPNSGLDSPGLEGVREGLLAAWGQLVSGAQNASDNYNRGLAMGAPAYASPLEAANADIVQAFQLHLATTPLGAATAGATDPFQIINAVAQAGAVAQKAEVSAAKVAQSRDSFIGTAGLAAPWLKPSEAAAMFDQSVGQDQNPHQALMGTIARHSWIENNLAKVPGSTEAILGQIFDDATARGQKPDQALQQATGQLPQRQAPPGQIPPQGAGQPAGAQPLIPALQQGAAAAAQGVANADLQQKATQLVVANQRVPNFNLDAAWKILATNPNLSVAAAINQARTASSDAALGPIRSAPLAGSAAVGVLPSTVGAHLTQGQHDDLSALFATGQPVTIKNLTKALGVEGATTGKDYAIAQQLALASKGPSVDNPLATGNPADFGPNGEIKDPAAAARIIAGAYQAANVGTGLLAQQNPRLGSANGIGLPPQVIGYGRVPDPTKQPVNFEEFVAANPNMTHQEILDNLTQKARAESRMTTIPIKPFTMFKTGKLIEDPQVNEFGPLGPGTPEFAPITPQHIRDLNAINFIPKQPTPSTNDLAAQAKVNEQQQQVAAQTGLKI